jgi:hypothetical protein
MKILDPKFPSIAVNAIKALKHRKKILWWMKVSTIIAAAFAILIAIYFWLASAAMSADSQADKIQYEQTARQHTLVAAGGMVAVAMFILRLRAQYHREKESKELLQQRDRELKQRQEHHQSNEYDAQQRRITEMRIKVVEQLGSDNPAVRIGGIHNLQRLGMLHKDLRTMILAEICAYLRMPFSFEDGYHDRPPQGHGSESSMFEPVGPPPREAPLDWVQERQVRLEAQRLLEVHLGKFNDIEDYWDHQEINLSGATLESIDFHGCEIRNPNFEGTRFVGSVTRFDKSVIKGHMSFWNSRFDTRVAFDLTEFQTDANFASTVFHDTAYFNLAKFQQHAHFGGCDFKRGASFDGSSFTGVADLSTCRFLSLVSFSLAKFDHQLLFDYSVFEQPPSFSRLSTRWITEDAKSTVHERTCHARINARREPSGLPEGFLLVPDPLHDGYLKIVESPDERVDQESKASKVMIFPDDEPAGPGRLIGVWVALDD